MPAITNDKLQDLPFLLYWMVIRKKPLPNIQSKVWCHL